MRAVIERHLVRELFAVRDFRRLLAVRLVGQCGDGLLQGAMFGAAFFNPDRATTAGAAAVAFAVLLLPYSSVGPFAGVLLDRWSRQRTLLVSNLVRTALVGLVAASLATAGPTSAPTVLLALLAISVNRFVLSGLSAGLPQVVPAGHLITANALTTTLGTGATTVGALLSLGLRAGWGDDDPAAGAIAAVAAAGYAVAALLASSISRWRLGPAEHPAGADHPPRAPLRAEVRLVAAGLLAGARQVRRTAPALRALAVIAVQRFLAGIGFMVVLLVHTPRGYLGGGIGRLAWVVGGVVTGGLLAALVTPAATRRIGRDRWVVGCLGLAALAAGGLLPWYRPWLLVVAGLVLGFAAQGVKVCVDTLLQESMADRFRGRVFALYDVLFNVAFVAAAALAAVLVPDDGHSVPVVLGLAGGYTAAALGYALAVRRP